MTIEQLLAALLLPRRPAQVWSRGAQHLRCPSHNPFNKAVTVQFEWAVFAGFAFYLGYRLARDAWEKEVEDIEDAAAAGA